MEGTVCPGGAKPLSILFNAVYVLVCPSLDCTAPLLDSISISGTNAETGIVHTCITPTNCNLITNNVRVGSVLNSFCLLTTLYASRCSTYFLTAGCNNIFNATSNCDSPLE